jgi:nitrogen regulatory protein P-II 1
MKRLDLLVTHEHLLIVNEILHKHNVGGMTFYDVKGRGRTDLEPVEAGRGIMRRVPEFSSKKDRSSSCRFLGKVNCP